ncbi:MAG: iron donor protein CyaY [Aeromonadaceae bacterium]|nr:iron donor protein CyaY [Aeromonadaceae bacterium]
MKESEFHALAEAQFLAIEEAVEAATERSDADIDADTSGGVLTLSFANQSKIIINKQAPLSQIWVATRANGYHFDYRDGQWIDNREGHELMALLTQACSEQAGQPVELN